MQALSNNGEEMLSVREQLFIARYLVSYNATAAGEINGWSPSDCSQVMRKPAVRKAIEQAMGIDAMAPTEIIARLSAMARSTLEDVVDVDESGYGRVNLKKAKKAGKLGMVQELSYDNNGQPKVKMVSALDAMEKLAKINAMFTEKLEINTTNKIDVNINKQVMVKAMSDPALLERLSALADAVADRGMVEVQATVVPQLPPSK